MDKIPKYKGIDLMYKIHNTYTVCKREEMHQSQYPKHDDCIENLPQMLKYKKISLASYLFLPPVLFFVFCFFYSFYAEKSM